jgi:hypothetical protein
VRHLSLPTVATLASSTKGTHVSNVSPKTPRERPQAGILCWVQAKRSVAATRSQYRLADPRRAPAFPDAHQDFVFTARPRRTRGPDPTGPPRLSQLWWLSPENLGLSHRQLAVQLACVVQCLFVCTLGTDRSTQPFTQVGSSWGIEVSSETMGGNPKPKPCPRHRNYESPESETKSPRVGNQHLESETNSCALVVVLGTTHP